MRPCSEAISTSWFVLMPSLSSMAKVLAGSTDSPQRAVIASMTASAAACPCVIWKFASPSISTLAARHSRADRLKPVIELLL